MVEDAAGGEDALPGRFLDILHASVTDDSAFDVLLAYFAERFACLSAALVYVDPGVPAATIAAGWGVLDAQAQRRYREHFASEDPAPAAMARLKVGQVVTTGRLFDADDERHRRFIRDFYHPLGLREALGGPVINMGGQLGVLAVQRGDNRTAFNDDDIDLFARHVPHVTAALRLRRRFFDLEDKAGRLRSALDGIATAVMICDAGGKLHHANRLARTFLDRRDGLLLTRSGRLGAATQAADQQLATLVFAGGKLPLVHVPRMNGGRPYIVKATRNEAGACPNGLDLRICDPDQADGDCAALLTFSLHMSPSSAELTAALLDGESLADFAERVGLSMNTVRFRLKGAFAATGARRQADLVRVAAAIVRDLG